MTQQEIINGNELIAAFMGLESFEDSRYGKLWPNPASDGIHAKTVFNLKYQKSWDWLMPVVEKIKSIPVNDGTELIRRIDKVVQSLYQIKIGVTYLLCVEFLQWYNSLSK